MKRNAFSAMDPGLNPRPLKRGVPTFTTAFPQRLPPIWGKDRVNAAGLKIYTNLLDRKLQEATGKSPGTGPRKH